MERRGRVADRTIVALISGSFPYDVFGWEESVKGVRPAGHYADIYMPCSHKHINSTSPVPWAIRSLQCFRVICVNNLSRRNSVSSFCMCPHTIPLINFPRIFVNYFPIMFSNYFCHYKTKIYRLYSESSLKSIQLFF